MTEQPTIVEKNNHKQSGRHNIGVSEETYAKIKEMADKMGMKISTFIERSIQLWDVVEKLNKRIEELEKALEQVRKSHNNPNPNNNNKEQNNDGEKETTGSNEVEIVSEEETQPDVAGFLVSRRVNFHPSVINYYLWSCAMNKEKIDFDEWINDTIYQHFSKCLGVEIVFRQNVKEG